MHTHGHTCTCTCIQAHTHTCTCTHTHTYKQTLAHSHKNMQAHTHTHTQTHTQTLVCTVNLTFSCSLRASDISTSRDVSVCRSIVSALVCCRQDTCTHTHTLNHENNTAGTSLAPFHCNPYLHVKCTCMLSVSRTRLTL